MAEIMIADLGPQAIERLETHLGCKFHHSIFELEIWVSDEGVRFKANGGVWSPPIGGVVHRDV